MQRHINISAHQGLDIVNPAQQHAARNNILSKAVRSLPTSYQQHRRKMRARGTTRNVNPPRIKSQRSSLPMQRSDRLPALLHNRSQRGPRCQGVIDRRERNSIRNAIRRRIKRLVLGVFLPVTSMDINQQRRRSGSRGKIIECFIRPLAPEQILLAAKTRLGVAAARDVCLQKRFNRSHTTARRILPLALGQRPIPPIGVVICHREEGRVFSWNHRTHSGVRNPRSQFFRSSLVHLSLHEAGSRHNRQRKAERVAELVLTDLPYSVPSPAYLSIRSWHQCPASKSSVADSSTLLWARALNLRATC